MPKMNGGELAKAARKLRPELPIVLATGYAELPNGFDLTLPRLGKPFMQEQLAAAIAKAMAWTTPSVARPGDPPATPGWPALLS